MKSLTSTVLTLMFFIVFTVVFGLPTKNRLIVRDENINDTCMVGDTDVDDLSDYLEKTRPEVVLIGNSMLGEALDQDLFSAQSGMKTAKVWFPGSGSAWWYLVVKNIVSELKEKPKYVGIIFRDNYLTLPQHKVLGKHKRAVDLFAGRDEQLLDELAYYRSTSYPRLWAQRYIPLFNQREVLKEKVDDMLKSFAAQLVGVADSKKLDTLIAHVFDDKKMNQQMLNQRQLVDERAQDAYRSDMRFKPEQSFLPYIIDLAEKQGVSLFFVRVKRVRDLEPGRQSAELLRYISKLEKYLNTHSIPLIDFTREDQLTREHFALGDHLNRHDGRRLFTNILARQLLENVAVSDKKLVVTHSVGNQ